MKKFFFQNPFGVAIALIFFEGVLSQLFTRTHIATYVAALAPLTLGLFYGALYAWSCKETMPSGLRWKSAWIHAIAVLFLLVFILSQTRVFADNLLLTLSLLIFAVSIQALMAYWGLGFGSKIARIKA